MLIFATLLCKGNVFPVNHQIFNIKKGWLQDVANQKINILEQCLQNIMAQIYAVFSISPNFFNAKLLF